MKFSTLFVLPALASLVIGAPVPAPAPEADPLNLLGIDIPILDIPGLNLPLLNLNGAATTKASSAAASPTTTTPSAVQSIAPIPTGAISGLLTPLLENLGAPHQEVVEITDLVESVVSGVGLGSVAPVLNIVPTTISGETLNAIANVVATVVGAVVPATEKTKVIQTIMTTIENLTEITPNPAQLTGGSRKRVEELDERATALSTADVTALLNQVVTLLQSFKPGSSNILQLNAQFAQIAALLKQVVAAVVSVGKSLNLDELTGPLLNVVNQLLTYVGGISATNQLFTLTSSIPLVGQLGTLINQISLATNLPGPVGSLLNNITRDAGNGSLVSLILQLLDQLSTGLGSGKGLGTTVGTLLTNLLNSLGLGFLVIFNTSS